MKQNIWNKALLTAIIAGSMTLTACGGGGGGSSGGNSSVAKCAAVEGASDQLGDALSTLTAQLATIPAAGAAAAGLVDALAKITDAVDAIANIVQSAAMTQDPAQMADAGDAVGDAVSCGLGEVSTALTTLLGSVAAGTPAAGQIDTILSQIETLQDLLGSNPLSGGVPSADLADITSQLASLSTQLAVLLNQLPVSGTGIPEAHLVVAALSASILNFSVLLNEVGSLDASGTANALTTYYSMLANFFSSAALINAGPVSSAVTPIAAQVLAAANGVVPTLNQGLVMLLTPVFDAIRTVLGGSVSGPAQFQTILTGLIANTPVSGQFGDLVDMLSGGGSVDPLSTLLAGVPVLGLMVAEVLDSSADPALLLTAILNGAPGFPTLAELMTQIPGLTGINPGTVGGLSVITDLVESLLQLDDGIPVITGILQDLGGSFTQLSLLGTLLGMLLP